MPERGPKPRSPTLPDQFLPLYKKSSNYILHTMNLAQDLVMGNLVHVNK